MFKNYLPIEYLCIDIANCFGDDEAVGFRGDKSTFEEHIQWVKTNFNQLDQRAIEAENIPQYTKAVMALKDIIAGKPTGHLVALDGVCSGIQIMSAITGCMKGASITGLVNPNERSDAYAEITVELNRILTVRGLGNIQVTRAKAKEAIMPSIYGSRAKPIEIFGEELVNTYYEACHNKAEGAFTLLDILIDSWQPYTLAHSWYMPDGHFVHIKSMEKIETKIEIDELNHHTFDTSYLINKGAKKGVKLAAHVIHSIDAYVLRTMIRRTNYKPKFLKEKLALLQNTVTEQQTTMRSDLIDSYEDYYTNFKMVDVTTLAVINAANVHELSKAHVDALIKLVTTMLSFKPFEMLTIHDAFVSHSNHCNTVRYWYKEILAELAESQILNVILSQITGVNPRFKKFSNVLPNFIRNSNYSLS